MLTKNDWPDGRAEEDSTCNAARSWAEANAGFNPDDIEAIRVEMVQVEPFPVKERGEGKVLARQTSQDRFDLLAQLLADRISPARSVPVEQKVFLNLKEAAEYSGMPKAWLVREIKAGGWRIRRADLEQL